MFSEEMLLFGINFPITQSSVTYSQYAMCTLCNFPEKNKVPLWY